MADITITINNVKDSNVIQWLQKLRPLKNNIQIEQEEHNESLLEFWEGHKKILPDINHSCNPDILAVNINHFYEVLRIKQHVRLDKNKVLKIFKDSLGTGCWGYKAVNSKIFNKAIKCWIFEYPPERGTDANN